MSKIYQRFLVDCPYQRARGYLADFVGESALSAKERALHLTLPINTDSPALEKDVLVTFAKSEDFSHFDQPFIVHWAPKDGGAYPDFDGILVVRADEDFTNSALELRGVYTPPLGVPGKIFDTVLGSRIASITARELLRHLASDMVRRYREEEAEKAKAREGMLK